MQTSYFKQRPLNFTQELISYVFNRALIWLPSTEINDLIGIISTLFFVGSILAYSSRDPDACLAEKSEIKRMVE